jgi:hypothetical protein
MSLDRVSIGEKISAGSGILLFVSTFFKWYGVGVIEEPNLLYELHIFEDGGNAWQTLDVTPIFLTLVVVVAVGAALWQLVGQLAWPPSIPLCAVVCVLGGIAVCLILLHIIFPPELGGETGGYTFDATLETGIFFSLVAACGIAYGGFRTMREEGVSSPRPSML